jgi:hypothetical protein
MVKINSHLYTNCGSVRNFAYILNKLDGQKTVFFISFYSWCLANLFFFTRPLLSFFNTTSVHCPNNLIDVSLKKLFQCMSIGMFSYKNVFF